MQGTATTLPAKGIAQNCLILIFAKSVALAKEMHSVSPATNGGDGFNQRVLVCLRQNSIASSSCSALALPTAFPSPCLTFAFLFIALRAKRAKVSGGLCSLCSFARSPLPRSGDTLCSFARTAKRKSGKAMSLFVVADDEPWHGDHQRHMPRRWGRQRLGVAGRRRGDEDAQPHGIG